MDLPVEALFSTLGRTAARALEANIAPTCSSTSSTS
jgi:Ni,Fe-hydrogenase I large subunit